MHRPRKDGDRQEDIDLWQTLRSDQTLNITISSGGPRPAAYLKIRTGGGQIQSEGNRITPPPLPDYKTTPYLENKSLHMFAIFPILHFIYPFLLLFSNSGRRKFCNKKRGGIWQRHSPLPPSPKYVPTPSSPFPYNLLSAFFLNLIIYVVTQLYYILTVLQGSRK